MPDAIEIDASGFSGGSAGFPPPERWQIELLTPLELTARWGRKQDMKRINLSGSYRLSTAFALGHAFRSATGFEIDIPTKTGSWGTDEHSASGAVAPPSKITRPDGLIANRLVIGIGVLRDPTEDIRRELAGTEDGRVLLATLPQALTTGASAQASVQIIKAAIVEAVGRLRATSIDLFFGGPAALAVALGRRWNALPPTCVHEFLPSEGRYVPTARFE